MRKSTFENFSYGLAGRLLSQTLSFALMIYLARTLGPSEYGSLSLVVAIVGYFNILATLGLQVEGVREIARGQNDLQKSASLIFSLRIFLAICSYFLLLIYAYAFFFYSDLRMFNLLILYGLSLLSAAFFLDWYFVGREELHSLTKATLLGSLLSSLLTLSLVKGAEDIYLIPSLAFLGSLISCVYLMKIFLVRQHLEIRFEFKRFYHLLVVSMPFALSTAINQIHDNMDKILLGYFWGPTEVGYYSVAYRIVIVFSGLVGVYSQSTFSAMIRLNETDKTGALDFLQKNIHVMLYIMIPVVIGGTIMAPSIVIGFFGEKYAESVMPFILLLYYLFFMAFSITFANFLLSIKEDKQYVKILLCGAVVNTIANLAFIPGWKASGAAAAMIGTELIVFVYLFFLVRRAPIRGWIDKKFLFISLGSSSIMGAACYWLQQSLGLHVIIVLFCGSVIYFGLSGPYCIQYFKKALT
jgi:O-antigen/teichoic acid export membrane protein